MANSLVYAWSVQYLSTDRQPANRRASSAWGLIIPRLIPHPITAVFRNSGLVTGTYSVASSHSKIIEAAKHQIWCSPMILSCPPAHDRIPLFSIQIQTFLFFHSVLFFSFLFFFTLWSTACTKLLGEIEAKDFFFHFFLFCLEGLHQFQPRFYLIWFLLSAFNFWLFSSSIYFLHWASAFSSHNLGNVAIMNIQS